MQGIKGVKKFLLCRFLSYNKLDVIDEKNVDGAVFVTKSCHGLRITASDGFNHFIGKLFTCDVQNTHIRILFQNIVSDGMHQMRFTKSGTSVEKQGIVDRARSFCDSDAGRLCKTVIGADNKGIKAVFYVKVCVFCLEVDIVLLLNFFLLLLRFLIIVQNENDIDRMIQMFGDGCLKRLLVFLLIIVVFV